MKINLVDIFFRNKIKEKRINNVNNKLNFEKIIAQEHNSGKTKIENKKNQKTNKALKFVNNEKNFLKDKIKEDLSFSNNNINLFFLKTTENMTKNYNKIINGSKITNKENFSIKSNSILFTVKENKDNLESINVIKSNPKDGISEYKLNVFNEKIKLDNNGKVNFKNNNNNNLTKIIENNTNITELKKDEIDVLKLNNQNLKLNIKEKQKIESSSNTFNHISLKYDDKIFKLFNDKKDGIVLNNLKIRINEIINLICKNNINKSYQVKEKILDVKYESGQMGKILITAKINSNNEIYMDIRVEDKKLFFLLKENSHEIKNEIANNIKELNNLNLNVHFNFNKNDNRKYLKNVENNQSEDKDYIINNNSKKNKLQILNKFYEEYYYV